MTTRDYILFSIITVLLCVLASGISITGMWITYERTETHRIQGNYVKHSEFFADAKCGRCHK